MGLIMNVILCRINCIVSHFQSQAAWEGAGDSEKLVEVYDLA